MPINTPALPYPHQPDATVLGERDQESGVCVRHPQAAHRGLVPVRHRSDSH